MSEVLSDSFPDDNPIKTKGRILAEYLSKYSWYCSENVITKQTQNRESTPVKKPNLDDGWDFFEHISLPRCFQLEGDSSFTQAKPGKTGRATTFYPLIKTPVKDLADFGVGVGMYFNALKSLAIILFLAGLISIANISYFRSNDYVGQDSLATHLKGSAICTNTSFELCPNCTADDWNTFPVTKDRYGKATKEDGSQLNFILVNNCSLSNMFGIISYVTMVFVFVSITIFIYWEFKTAVAFDVAQQTATDYSIKIVNPPKDAKDPEKWKDFFESNFKDVQVTICTIAVDNEELIYALMDRRKLLQRLIDKLPLGESLNERKLDTVLDQLPDESSYFKLMLFDKTKIYKTVTRLEEKIKELSEKTVAVSTVFITFNTEQNQREVLEKMNIPCYNRKNLDERYQFEATDGKKTVLKISEPDEPSSIRWNDLDESLKNRFFLLTMTTIVFFAIIAIALFFINYAENVGGSYLSALVITTLNSVTPYIVKQLTSYESHPDETLVTTSLYIKMTIFRWTSTAIASMLFIPSTDIIQSQIPAVFAIYIVEIVKDPILQYVDIFGNINRHYFGPRALDQRRMNLCFQGSTYDLSERYTNLTKILFLTFFYCTIFPAAFLLASLSMTVTFVMDKFSILRSWKRGPKIGSKVATFSNMYFLPLCFLAYAITSSSYYYSFPLDKACKSTELVSNIDTGGYNITTSDNKSHEVEIESGDYYFEFCKNQNMWHSFPLLPKLQSEGLKWMTNSQENFSRLYGWTSLVILCIVSAIIVYSSIGKYLYSLFFKTYKPDGKATKIQFDEVVNMKGYIPQVKIPGFAFPFLICDINDIDARLIGWKNPRESYEYHNMIFDVHNIMKTDREEVVIEEVVSNGEDIEIVSSHNTTLKMDLGVSYPFSLVKSWKL